MRFRVIHLLVLAALLAVCLAFPRYAAAIVVIAAGTDLLSFLRADGRSPASASPGRGAVREMTSVERNRFINISLWWAGPCLLLVGLVFLVGDDPWLGGLLLIVGVACLVSIWTSNRRG
jgi:hypothetical protein